MDSLVRYIDEVMDYFPINKITKKMRQDLFEAASTDYESLVSQGVDEQEAVDHVMGYIETPETLAKQIPNTHYTWYYVLLAVMVIVCLFIYQYTRQPDFLQIFLPARLEFPYIIKRLIQYTMACFLFYPFVMLFYRYLPQKYLSRSFNQSMVLLYLGTLLSSLYFAIAMAYVWFTFNGFLVEELTATPFSTFMYYFYLTIIKPAFGTLIYACVNTLCFVFSVQYYHLEKKPEAYNFSLIYQRDENQLFKTTIAEQTETEEKHIEEPKETMIIESEPIEKEKPKKSFKEIFSKFKHSAAVTEEEITAVIEEKKEETLIQKTQEKIPQPKKKKRKNKYANIQVAKDVKKAKKTA